MLLAVDNEGNSDTKESARFIITGSKLSPVKIHVVGSVRELNVEVQLESDESQ